jgi:hypothetical protein
MNCEVTKLKWKLSRLSGTIEKGEELNNNNILNLPHCNLRDAYNPFEKATLFLEEHLEDYTVASEAILFLTNNNNPYFRRVQTEPNKIIAELQGHDSWQSFANRYTSKPNDTTESIFNMDDIERLSAGARSLFVSILVGNAWSKSTPSNNWRYPRIISWNENEIFLSVTSKGLFIGKKGATIKSIERLVSRKIKLF